MPQCWLHFSRHLFNFVVLAAVNEVCALLGVIRFSIAVIDT